MIECIFTLDYEIYGNGDGSLNDLVYEPTERLRKIFRRWDASFVVFVEVAELERIEREQSDASIGLVKRQVRQLYQDGFELGLHLHPQWYNARRENGGWVLDDKEYNLCVLPPTRIAVIVDRSIAYLQDLAGTPDFVPLSFRAGNWLFQPTRTAAAVLVDKGIKIDSSVFKGGLQRIRGLDYRPAIGNGYYWRFADDVNREDPTGRLVEFPTYTVMVPSWRMATSKRLAMGKKKHRSALGGGGSLKRFLDFLRFRYPLKLDFCRLTLVQLTALMDGVIRDDQEDPAVYRPIVAIGHSKDLIDDDTVEQFLNYLKEKGIAATTLEGAYDRCQRSS